MDINNIFINTDSYFQNYKNIILEKFISYYGEQYRDIITNRINSSYIGFSSSPIEDFRYISYNRDEIDNKIMDMLEERYFIYRKLSDGIKNDLSKKYIDYLLNKIEVKNIDYIKKNIDIFTQMFTCCEFKESYIDAFTTENDSILNNPNTSTTIKKKFTFYRDKFNKNNVEFSFGLKELSSFLADRIIEFRQKIQEEYKITLAQTSEFGKNILKKMQDFHNINLSEEELSFITFIPNSYCGSIGCLKDVGIKWHNYIRVPLTLLLNNGITTLDTDIIHELIHCIETSGWYVGITSHINGENRIANEIQTQKLALKITEELHKEGVYIFDNPKNCKLYGQSTYEFLFPISYNFFDKYEDIFKDCSIRNDRQLLVKNFGKDWYNYSKYLDSIFDKYIGVGVNLINNSVSISFDNTYSNLITNMESHYNNINDLQKTKIYTYNKK